MQESPTQLKRLGEYTVGGDKVSVARNLLAKLEGALLQGSQRLPHIQES
jgi:hypothetical protein